MKDNPPNLSKDPDFRVFNWGKDQVDLRDKRIVIEMMPTECHIKEDGTLDKKPSLAFVLEDRFGNQFFAQISLRMFQPVLDEIERLKKKA